MLYFASLDPRGYLVHRRVRHRILTDDRDRRGVAAADARRAQDANVGAKDGRKPRKQLLRSGQLARNRVADAHGYRRRWSVAFFHDVEVVIERGHFVDLGHRHLHLGGERHQMRRRETAEVILNQVQVLDEEIAATRFVAEERRHLPPRFGVNWPAFRERTDTRAFAFGRGHWTD